MAIEIPSDFQCPIGVCPMTNPVRTDCGHIFEKIIIKTRMIADRRCPMCRALITELTPHAELKNRVHDFIRENPEMFENKTVEMIREENEADWAFFLERAREMNQVEFAEEFDQMLHRFDRLGAAMAAEQMATPASVILANAARTVASDFVGSIKPAVINAIVYGSAAATLAAIGYTTGATSAEAIPSAALCAAQLGASLGIGKHLLRKASQGVFHPNGLLLKLQNCKYPAYAIGGTLLAGAIGGPFAATAAASVLALRTVAHVIPEKAWEVFDAVTYPKFESD